MTFLFDMAHPAAVHYFKNIIFKLKEGGHEVVITARDKDITQQLLRNYKLPFIDLGIMQPNFFSRLIFMIKGEIRALYFLSKYKPDVVVSMGTIFFAHACFIKRVPYVVFDDTEHALLNRILYKPFARRIFTPACYTTDLGKKQFRFNAVMELLYLHPSQTIKWDSKALNEQFVERPFAIIRFISWDAFHDSGTGAGIVDKMALLNLVKKYMEVYLSIEGDVPKALKDHVLRIEPENIHLYLEKASLYIGEGATTASESAMLGTPAVYINPLPLGYITAEEKWGLLYNLGKSKNVLEEVEQLLKAKDLKEKTLKNQKHIISSFINPSDFFIWYFSNYPESDREIINDPEIQYRYI